MKKDIVILGAGPVGMFATFYAGMRQMSVALVDQLGQVGGQLTAFYPEKKIYDVAGFDGIKAKDLVKNLEKQIAMFKDTTDIILDNQIIAIEKKEERKFIVKTDKMEIEAKAVIIAGGTGGFSPRKMGLENEDNFDNIEYFIKSPEDYKDKKVAIFGGGDSAVDFALMLEGIAKEVNIIHRRDEFRAHDYSVKLLKESSVNIYTPYTPQQLIGQNDKINTVVIKSKEDTKEIEVDNVICNFGFTSKIGPIAEFGLELDNKKIIVDSFQKTSIDGIFSVGDICNYPGKASLIVVGFGEVPIAINAIYQYLNPDNEVKTVHSSVVMGGINE